MLLSKLRSGISSSKHHSKSSVSGYVWAHMSKLVVVVSHGLEADKSKNPKHLEA